MDSFTTAMNVDDTIVVKVSFNGDLRRFTIPKGASFKALNDQVVAILGQPGADLVLKYTDEDGDLVTISSDWELNSATKPGQVLRLTALSKAQPQVSAPAFPSAPVASPSLYPQMHGGPFAGMPHQHHRGHAGPFPASPVFQHAPPMASFGGPAPAAPGPFGGPAQQAGPGPFGAPFQPFAGGCGGWGRKRFSPEEWANMKKDMKARKAQMSSEEWAKLKEERKRMCKEHKEMRKEHKKMAKKGHHGHGHGFGGHPHHGGGGYFGPHYGGRGHPHHPHHSFGGPHGACEMDTEKLSARFAKDVTIEDGTQIPAGASFVKTWRIRNEGEAWPVGCVLRLLSKQSDAMGSPETVPVPFEAPVATGQEFDLSVPLIAPAKAGRYTAYYKLCTPAGKKFGQRLWVSVVVPSMSSSSSSEGEKEADKYECLVDTILAMGFTAKRHRVFRLLQKNDGDVNKVIQILHEKIQHKAMKEQRKAQKAAKKSH